MPKFEDMTDATVFSTEAVESPAHSFLTLKPEQRRVVHFALCEHALRKWNLYVSTQKRIQYRESVVGTQQEVDMQLPIDAFEAAKQGRDSTNIRKRYREPIAAMQDDDLVFPENITFAYYALYNLFRKYVQGDSVDDGLIVNQAIASETDNSAWEALLISAVRTAV